jgi:putative endopeptidase
MASASPSFIRAVGMLALLCVSAGTCLSQTPAPAKPADAYSATAPDKPPINVKSFDLDAIDKTADPCADFYQYSCGNWIKHNPIPSDQAAWQRSFAMLAERNYYLLWQQLDAASKSPKTPLEKQYGDYFGACMDIAQIQRTGVAVLDPIFAIVDGLSDPKKLSATVGALAAAGQEQLPFNISVQQDLKDSSKQIASLSQGGLALPDRDYYLSDEKRFQTIREQYVAHMVKMFTMAGDPADKAAQEAAAVLHLETELARISMTRTDMRTPENIYHIDTLAQLHDLAPDFDFDSYRTAIGLGHFDTIDVEQPDFIRGMNKLMLSEPVAVWKAYLRWHVLHDAASDLPKPFFDEDFAFFDRTLEGQDTPTPRWKNCTYATDGALGEAVGQDWVKQYFPPNAKDSMDRLVAALDKALAQDISDLPWMSADTKKAAEEKLALFRNKIGYPEKWRDYSALTVNREDWLGDEWRSSVFDRQYRLAKLGKPVDEKEWGMTPPTVNAYYDSSNNDVNFPAGILQPPFFDASIDPAVNFGAIGMVIGHEMTHGFDDEGSKFDGHGNLREWQTAADRKAFTERTDCEAAEYSGFTASPAHDGQAEVKLNGKLTLGENTADNGGLRIAYIALHDTLKASNSNPEAKIDNYTADQRFFLGFAQVWCENLTDEYRRQGALTDPHSSGMWRVNGAIQNFEEFGKAFHCKKGQPMYPVHSCRVW